jgi:hypothetical protein
MHAGTRRKQAMRLLPGLLISTLALGTFAITGCAEHRYRTDPYYGYGGGYSGYYADNDPYYRQWLAERRYDYVDYNRLSRERQQEYWQWRRQNEARFRQDQRFRDNQRYAQNGNYSNGRYANDHDRDDRRTNNYARTRDGDKDRHQRDLDRHQVRKDNNKDRDRDHDRDHDRR